MSASKAFNLPGLKAAVAVAGAETAEDLARLPEIVSHGPSHLGVLAHTAALRQGGEWLDAVLDGLDGQQAAARRAARRAPAGRDLDAARSDVPGLAGLHGGLGFDDPRTDAAALGDVTVTTGQAAVFLDRARVALSSGPAFGTGGAGHVRLNFATSPEILTEALRRMGAVAAAAG